MRFVELHTQRKTHLNPFCFSAYEEYDIATEYEDGKPDFWERKFCNWMTAKYENCTAILRGNCFPDEEVNFWIDIDLDIQLTDMELNDFTNWDSQMCPPFR